MPIDVARLSPSVFKNAELKEFEGYKHSMVFSHGPELVETMFGFLKKHDLTNILTVSIRYFGGIKLGAGGLVRAYTKSVAGAIEQAVFTTKQLYHILHVSIPFDMIGSVEKYLRDNVSLLDTTYTEQVTYQIKVHASQCDEIITTLTNNTKGSVKIENIHQVEEYE